MPDYDLMDRRLRSVILSYLRADPAQGERTSDLARTFRVPEFVIQKNMEALLDRAEVRAEEGKWYSVT